MFSLCVCVCECFSPFVCFCVCVRVNACLCAIVYWANVHVRCACVRLSVVRVLLGVHEGLRGPALFVCCFCVFECAGASVQRDR